MPEARIQPPISMNDLSVFTNKIVTTVTVLGPKLYLTALFAVSLILSSLLTVFISYPRGAGTDGAFYALSGSNFFMGNGFTYSDVPNTFTWPLFSIILGLMNLLFNDLQISGHITLILSFSLSIFPFYYTAKNLFNAQTARLAVVLYSLNGFLLRLSGRFLAETLLILLLFVSLYFVSRVIKSLKDASEVKMSDILFSSFFLGLSYLTKPEAVQYFVIVWIYLSIVLIKFRRSYFKHSILMLLVYLLTVFPQIRFIHETTGKWELTTYNRFLFRGYLEPFFSLSPGEAAKDPRIEYNYNAYIIRGEYTSEDFQKDLSGLGNHARKFFKSLLTIIGPVHLILLLLSWFIYSPTNPHSRNLTRYLLIPVITLFFWFSPVDRHFILFVPLFLLISADVLNDLSIKYPKLGHRLLWIGSLFLFLQSYTPIANQAPTNAVIGNHQKMGEWMRDHLPESKGKLIADRKPYITFLAQGRYYRYNKPESYNALIDLLKQNKVDYLIVDDFYTRTKNPGVSELLDGKNRPELEFVHSVTDEKWGRAILYKIK